MTYVKGYERSITGDRVVAVVLEVTPDELDLLTEGIDHLTMAQVGDRTADVAGVRYMLHQAREAMEGDR